MSIPKDIIRENDGLGQWCILSAYRGSIAHGMYVPNSDPNSVDDKDAMALCVPPREYYFGLRQYGSRGTKEIKRGEWDIVIYEIRKVVSLLAKANPNVLSLLWLGPQYYMRKTAAGQLLLDARDIFSTKASYHAFCGYANSQLHRMTHMAFEGYMGEKRKSLVRAHGYDTKNASHLIRLLRMGAEFLSEGELHVERTVDATELLDIKRGEWSLEKVKQHAEDLFTECRQAYLSSPLPPKADMDKVNELCANIVEEALGSR